MKTKTKKWILYISMVLVAVNSMTAPFNLQKYIPAQVYTTKIPIIFIASAIVLWGIVWMENDEV